MDYDFVESSPYYAHLASNFPLILRVLFAFEMLYLWALAVLKCSVLCFYLRVFVSRQMQLWTKSAIVFTLAWVVAYTLGFFFICHPVPFQWDPSIPDGMCGDQITLYSTLIVTNILNDLFVMGLPMWSIWHLRMRNVEKAGITVCLALGLAVVAISCARMGTVYQNDMRGNLTGTMGTTILLCNLEVILGIICVSIPMLRPIYMWFSKRSSSARLDGEERSSGNDEEGGLEASSNKKWRLGRDPYKLPTGVETRHGQDEWEMGQHRSGQKEEDLGNHASEDVNMEDTACSIDRRSERSLT
ncbi:hypothetical protein F4778DRAFT_778143 [Xylariomycetidae sp. FL2044]|nr:hypothetical protein F4778DRAFT_778143 [Xylariomycetidae sp. FL2044]